MMDDQGGVSKGGYVLVIVFGALVGLLTFFVYLCAYPITYHDPCDPHRVHSVDVAGCE